MPARGLSTVALLRAPAPHEGLVFQLSLPTRSCRTPFGADGRSASRPQVLVPAEWLHTLRRRNAERRHERGGLFTGASSQRVRFLPGSHRTSAPCSKPDQLNENGSSDTRSLSIDSRACVQLSQAPSNTSINLDWDADGR